MGTKLPPVVSGVPVDVIQIGFFLTPGLIESIDEICRDNGYPFCTHILSVHDSIRFIFLENSSFHKIIPHLDPTYRNRGFKSVVEIPWDEFCSIIAKIALK